MFIDIIKINKEIEPVKASVHTVEAERYMRVSVDTIEEANQFIELWIKVNVDKEIFSEFTVAITSAYTNTEECVWNAKPLIDYIVENDLRWW